MLTGRVFLPVLPSCECASSEPCSLGARELVVLESELAVLELAVRRLYAEREEAVESSRRLLPNRQKLLLVADCDFDALRSSWSEAAGDAAATNDSGSVVIGEVLPDACESWPLELGEPKAFRDEMLTSRPLRPKNDRRAPRRGDGAARPEPFGVGATGVVGVAGVAGKLASLAA